MSTQPADANPSLAEVATALDVAARNVVEGLTPSQAVAFTRSALAHTVTLLITTAEGDPEHADALGGMTEALMAAFDALAEVATDLPALLGES